MLTLRILSPVEDGTEIEMILNRDRARYRRSLEVLLDGEPRAFDILDEKDLRSLSFTAPPGATRLTFSMGLPPPESVPFFLTQVGQQLISFLIILALVIAVLLAWR